MEGFKSVSLSSSMAKLRGKMVRFFCVWFHLLSLSRDFEILGRLELTSFVDNHQHYFLWITISIIWQQVEIGELSFGFARKIISAEENVNDLKGLVIFSFFGSKYFISYCKLGLLSSTLFSLGFGIQAGSSQFSIFFSWFWHSINWVEDRVQEVQSMC